MFAGSSPLTRGTRIDSGQNDRFNRFIPAYAGNSCSNAPVSATIPVHPRLRGELAVVTAQRIVKSGSSPLTRGTRENSSPHEFHGRFIPAYAGNSNDHFRPLRNFEIHPRLRGELRIFLPRSFIAVGSSPLTRGTRERRRSYQLCCSVHPRLRGEL